MDKPKPPSKPTGEAARGYTAALIHLLADMDFAEARRAASALGETADPAAIKALVFLVRESSALRAAAITALKKSSVENEAAATELAIALLKEKHAELPTDAELAPVSEEDRRRSPRVLLEILVQVIWTDAKGERHTERATTKVVNAYGALLHLQSQMVVDTELEIHNVTTMAKLTARVVWVGDPDPHGGQEIGIELGDPDPDFWVGKQAGEESSFQFG
ncbi:MAG: hypothetical protein A3D93_04480 [Acidobacteria bacterium RIFCSPHIGHO2_12_FULL_67_30]|nr:MAG: hypothetical protein A3B65_07365 [Acidobacteria bacterium RIFCSPHIGHO2_02_FULL_67_57]OFV85214.1 MAG: hypothetical protein A2620_03800 [Acidobacteria bacterium RIFCSPHIGHO2_01_FULL_67_28]OFV87095.1 MAG: hypothetical protein A3D93_04480 [Acidobacteria bacterium RIFCSPHIGHO2_12_FULL_67_30]